MGLSEGAARHEAQRAPHLERRSQHHPGLRSIGAHTEADLKAEECRNAMFDVSPCVSVLHVSFSLK